MHIWLPGFGDEGWGEMDLGTALFLPGFSGQGSPGGANFDQLKQQAIKALLDPKCAIIFGGLMNALMAMANSSYNMYTAGQANPYPGLINSGNWATAVNAFQDPTTYGFSFSFRRKPGGVTFFGNRFSSYAPGFAAAPGQITQMTGFLHELEHDSVHDLLHGAWIDSDYTADANKLNTNCNPRPIETQSVPVTGGLTPPPGVPQ